ncbi:MAG: H(+)/Cl(-) exchange transporter ClcA [Geminicoccaceae bacterium]
MSQGDRPPLAQWAADIGGRVFWLALLVGLIVGILGSAFHWLLDLVAGWRTALMAGGLDPALQGLLGPLAAAVPMPVLRFVLMALIAMAAITVARWMVRRLAPEAAGSGVQEIEGAMLGERPLRWARVIPVKFLGGLLSLGSGFALGREGPTVHMGGAAGLAVAELSGSRHSEAMALVAAGAGAGIAAAFNAPIAGVLFVIEEMRREARYSFQGYHAVFIACFAATFVTERMAGLGPELPMAMQAPSLAHYPFFVLLGAALGALGVLFNRMVLRTLDLFAAWNRVAGWSQVVVMALVLATLLQVMPAATTGGEAIVPTLAGSVPGLGFLVMLFLARYLFTLGSYAMGTPGGVFAPILALATTAGLVIAQLCSALLPGFHPEHQAVAAAAMAALFTGSVRAPLVGIVLVAELFDAYAATLATGVSVVTASLTAATLGGRPLYELLLERTMRLAGAPPRDKT